MDRAKVKNIALSTAVLASFFITAPTFAQQDERLKEIVEEVDLSNKIAQESQARIDTTVNQTNKLFNEYKQILKVNSGLRAYNEQIRRVITRQKKEIAKIEENISNIDEIKRQVTPLMIDMIVNLENFVELDVPFQKDERLARIQTLSNAMDDPNVNDPERFRVILEAYNSEVTYGRTINAYEGTAPDGRSVNFARLGRVGFYYQTKDGQETFAWSKANNSWEELGPEYRTSIRQLIRMANRQVQQDITVLPLPAPEEK